MRALVEEASQAGATRALGALGLDDPRARRDMDELRELLSAWRDAKRRARQAVVSWAVRVLALLAGWLSWLIGAVHGAFPGEGRGQGDAQQRFGAPGPRPSQGNGCALRAMRRFSTGRTGAGMWSGRGVRGELEAGGEVPLLWQHKAGRVIGRIEHLSEDKRGLRVIAELGAGEDAARAARLLRERASSMG